MTEENAEHNAKGDNKNKNRLKFSRIETDLNHLKKNCQIGGIKEIEKVCAQIKKSREIIHECSKLL